MNRKIYNSLLAIIAGTCLVNNANAQTMLDSVTNELYRINKVFDSSAYVTFGTRILYYTDTTTYGKFLREEKQVEYSLNNKNYYYKTDEIEFMQNDSFTVNIDHAEKMMIASKNVSGAPSDQFMLNNFISSTVAGYSSSYTISLVDIDSVTKLLSFTLNNPLLDSTVAYRYFSVLYDKEVYMPLQMKIELAASITIDEGENQGSDEKSKQFLQVDFENYRGILSTKVFDETTYLFYDRGLKQYMPSEKFKYYQFLSAGLNE